MRIKMYENFSSDVIKNRVSFITNFKENVENIFVELLDEKYLVDVNVTNNNNNYKGYFKCCVVIQLSKFSKKEEGTFRFEDIRDSLVMFEDYTKEYVNKDFEIEIAYHKDNSEYGFTDVVKSFENFGGDMDWLESAHMNCLKIDVYIKHD